ncbi:hypothetical protein ZIOFF_068337 [Zingiber officinale]|uniref:Uncharacterized protein n=1 Tax=Zingiber officinale TaxID=94328 RepID=A0A8J5C7V0_ZINOF|nr:hypothetical protein ZIOFF_068337 [Zingiber officinale]
MWEEISLNSLSQDTYAPLISLMPNSLSLHNTLISHAVAAASTAVDVSAAGATPKAAPAMLSPVGGVIFWAWVDAEMCSRLTRVIPRLLRRINKLEVDARSAKNTMKELKIDICKLLLESNTTKRRIRQMLMG